jgi:hypothetical protein
MSLDYWYVWPIGIAIWLVLGWAFFAYFEYQALKKNPAKDHISLSMFFYTVFTKFPLAILLVGFICGMFFGGLGVHFLWHWCPGGGAGVGLLSPFGGGMGHPML